MATKNFFAWRAGECLSIPFMCALHGCIDIVAFSHPIAYTENDRMYRDSMEEMIVSDECMSRVEDGKMIRCDRLLRVGQTLQVSCSKKSMAVVVRGIVGDWVFLNKLELRSQRKRITLREMFNLNRN